MISGGCRGNAEIFFSVLPLKNRKSLDSRLADGSTNTHSAARTAECDKQRQYCKNNIIQEQK